MDLVEPANRPSRKAPLVWAIGAAIPWLILVAAQLVWFVVDRQLTTLHVAAAGVTAVGANCGRGPDEMATIAAQMVEARPEGLLLIAQSNAGLPQVVGDHFEYDASPADMASHATDLRDLGIDLIGACCGSTPAHVDAISRALA